MLYQFIVCSCKLPKIDSCGTPAFTGNYTLMYGHLRQLFEIVIDLSLKTSSSYQTLSKSLDISKKAVRFKRCLSKAVYILSIMDNT